MNQKLTIPKLKEIIKDYNSKNKSNKILYSKLNKQQLLDAVNKIQNNQKSSITADGGYALRAIPIPPVIEQKPKVKPAIGKQTIPQLKEIIKDYNSKNKSNKITFSKMNKQQLQDAVNKIQQRSKIAIPEGNPQKSNVSVPIGHIKKEDNKPKQQGFTLQDFKQLQKEKKNEQQELKNYYKNIVKNVEQSSIKPKSNFININQQPKKEVVKQQFTQQQMREGYEKQEKQKKQQEKKLYDKDYNKKQFKIQKPKDMDFQRKPDVNINEEYKMIFDINKGFVHPEQQTSKLLIQLEKNPKEITKLYGTGRDEDLQKWGLKRDQLRPLVDQVSMGDFYPVPFNQIYNNQPLIDMLKGQGIDTILEPTSGIGSIIQGLIQVYKDKIKKPLKIYSNEISKDLIQIQKQELNPQIKDIQYTTQDFIHTDLNQQIDQYKDIDCIFINPPFTKNFGYNTGDIKNFKNPSFGLEFLIRCFKLIEGIKDKYFEYYHRLHLFIILPQPYINQKNGNIQFDRLPKHINKKLIKQYNYDNIDDLIESLSWLNYNYISNISFGTTGLKAVLSHYII